MTFTTLRNALATIVEAKEAILLSAAGIDHEPQSLLNGLPERTLGRSVQYMPGFYIAAVSESRCLGEVLYRIKRKPA